MCHTPSLSDRLKALATDGAVEHFAEKAEMARRRWRTAKAMRELDRMRDELAKEYPNAPETVELIREDRDNRSISSWTQAS